MKDVKVKILDNSITVMDKNGKPVKKGETVKVPESHYKKYKKHMMRVNVKPEKAKEDK